MDTPIPSDKFKYFSSIYWVDSKETTTSSKSIRILTNEYGGFYSIAYGPTINCQWLCLGHIQTICDKAYAKEIFKDILLVVKQQQLNKAMIMIDVDQAYVKSMKTLFEPYLKNNPYIDANISLEAPYTSSNGSQMCILLFNMDWTKVTE